MTKYRAGFATAIISYQVINHIFSRCDSSPQDFEYPCYPIMYPKPSRECTMFTRSAAACQTDPTNIKVREQLNLITSYIDGSQIYGSSLEQANELRDFTEGKEHSYTHFTSKNVTLDSH